MRRSLPTTSVSRLVPWLPQLATRLILCWRLSHASETSAAQSSLTNFWRCPTALGFLPWVIMPRFPMLQLVGVAHQQPRKLDAKNLSYRRTASQGSELTQTTKFKWALGPVRNRGENIPGGKARLPDCI